MWALDCSNDSAWDDEKFFSYLFLHFPPFLFQLHPLLFLDSKFHFDWTNSGLAAANSSFDTLNAQSISFANQMNAALEMGAIIGLMQYRQSYLDFFSNLAKEIDDKKLEIENRHKNPTYLNDNKEIARNCDADQEFIRSQDAKGVAKSNEIISAGNVDQGNIFGNEIGRSLAKEARDQCINSQIYNRMRIRFLQSFARFSQFSYCICGFCSNLIALIALSTFLIRSCIGYFSVESGSAFTSPFPALLIIFADRCADFTTAAGMFFEKTSHFCCQERQQPNSLRS
ncbi:MAG: hypothetical protein ABI041_17255 [Bdellovibrionia bacterium]